MATFVRSPISDGVGGTVTWPNMPPGAYVVVIEGWGYSEGEYALAYGCPPDPSGGAGAPGPSTVGPVSSTSDQDPAQTDAGTTVAVTVVRLV